MSNVTIKIPKHTKYVPIRSREYMKSQGYSDRDIRRVLGEQGIEQKANKGAL